MKKIILAFDGSNFPEAAFEFARKLNEVQPILLTGAFLPQALLANLWSYAAPSGELNIPLVGPEETQQIQQNITRFEALCTQNKINFKIHKDFFDLGLTALEKESIFADLVILGSQEFYKNAGNGDYNAVLEQALHDVHCPVMLVPDHFSFPQNIILAYNGTEESVFAIKQFIYLFPELLNNPVVIAYASKNEEENIPEKKNIEELVKGHFKNVSFHKLHADPKTFFNTWAMENKGAMIVSGSFSRSGLSQFFKKSFVNEMIAWHQLPIFIAHR